MLAPLTRELLLYSLQIALLVSAGALAMRAGAVPYPQARLACWRLLFAACVLLPLWPARVVDVTIPGVAPPTFSGTAISPDSLAAPVPAAHVQPTIWILINALPLIVVAGIIVRAAWLAAGLLSLIRLASSAGDVVDTSELRELHAHIAPHSTVYWHAGIDQPVAFGLWRPVVLLPEPLKDKPRDVQSAALAHELLHVARSDWLTGILEQAVLCMFW